MNSASNIPWKKAVSAVAHKNYRILLTMEDGEKLEMDLTPLISDRESFRCLKNFRYFRKVGLDPLGGLCWPGGEDICPTRIFYYAVEQADVPAPSSERECDSRPPEHPPGQGCQILRNISFPRSASD